MENGDRDVRPRDPGRELRSSGDHSNGVPGGDAGTLDATMTEDSAGNLPPADANGDTASASEAGDEGANEISDATPEGASDSGADITDSGQDATAAESVTDSGADSGADAGLEVADADASSAEDAHDGAAVVDSAAIGDAGGGAPDGTASDAAGAADSGATCTPLVPHSFPCAASPCANSATEYCIFGPVPNSCQPLPVACQCQETFNCECLSTHLTCDGDAGFNASCDPHGDAGLVESVDAALSSYFWIAAHTCH